MFIGNIFQVPCPKQTHHAISDDVSIEPSFFPTPLSFDVHSLSVGDQLPFSQSLQVSFLPLESYLLDSLFRFTNTMQKLITSTLNAFINCKGGLLIIGVTESGLVAGLPLTRRHRDETLCCLAAALSGSKPYLSRYVAALNVVKLNQMIDNHNHNELFLIVLGCFYHKTTTSKFFISGFNQILERREFNDEYFNSLIGLPNSDRFKPCQVAIKSVLENSRPIKVKSARIVSGINADNGAHSIKFDGVEIFNQIDSCHRVVSVSGINLIDLVSSLITHSKNRIVVIQFSDYATFQLANSIKSRHDDVIADVMTRHSFSLSDHARIVFCTFNFLNVLFEDNKISLFSKIILCDLYSGLAVPLLQTSLFFKILESYFHMKLILFRSAAHVYNAFQQNFPSKILNFNLNNFDRRKIWYFHDLPSELQTKVSLSFRAQIKRSNFPVNQYLSLIESIVDWIINQNENFGTIIIFAPSYSFGRILLLRLHTVFENLEESIYMYHHSELPILKKFSQQNSTNRIIIGSSTMESIMFDDVSFVIDTCLTFSKIKNQNQDFDCKTVSLAPKLQLIYRSEFVNPCNNSIVFRLIDDDIYQNLDYFSFQSITIEKATTYFLRNLEFFTSSKEIIFKFLPDFPYDHVISELVQSQAIIFDGLIPTLTLFGKFLLRSKLSIPNAKFILFANYYNFLDFAIILVSIDYQGLIELSKDPVANFLKKIKYCNYLQSDIISVINLYKTFENNFKYCKSVNHVFDWIENYSFLTPCELFKLDLSVSKLRSVCRYYDLDCIVFAHQRRNLLNLWTSFDFFFSYNFDNSGLIQAFAPEKTNFISKSNSQLLIALYAIFHPNCLISTKTDLSTVSISRRLLHKSINSTDNLVLTDCIGENLSKIFLKLKVADKICLENFNNSNFVKVNLYNENSESKINHLFPSLWPDPLILATKIPCFPSMNTDPNNCTKFSNALPCRQVVLPCINIIPQVPVLIFNSKISAEICSSSIISPLGITPNYSSQNFQGLYGISVDPIYSDSKKCLNLSNFHLFNSKWKNVEIIIFLLSNAELYKSKIRNQSFKLSFSINLHEYSREITDNFGIIESAENHKKIMKKLIQRGCEFHRHTHDLRLVSRHLRSKLYTFLSDNGLS
ncbi:hypothetical protein RCL1_001361 [Eukaryota sp. TZLM3-RCL]